MKRDYIRLGRIYLAAFRPRTNHGPNRGFYHGNSSGLAFIRVRGMYFQIGLLRP